MSGHSHDHQHEHGHHHDDDFDWSNFAEQLELEAGVLMPLIDDVVANHTPDVDWPTVQHVLDLGCGPGVISCALARHAPRAHVAALDSSVQLLSRVREHAAAQQLATRVHTLEADMEAVLPAIRPMDVVWAGMVLHHVADPANVLSNLRALLQPGGTLVMIEFAGHPTAVPAGDAAEDAWNRMEAGVSESRNQRIGVDPLTIDWPGLLSAGGFDHITDQTLVVHRPAPLDATSKAWLERHIHRSIEWLDGQLSDADVADLSPLASRDDLFVRQERRVLTARRPLS
jgi:SAM-dependent methyltransferase